MRFLADESCNFSVVRALRSAGHDVVAIAEVSPREEDDDVRERAVATNCILITRGQGLWSIGLRKHATNGVASFLFDSRRAHGAILPIRWSKSSENEEND